MNEEQKPSKREQVSNWIFLGIIIVLSIALVVVDIFGTLVALIVAFAIVLALACMGMSSLKGSAIVFLIAFVILKILWLCDLWAILILILAVVSFLITIPEILVSLVVEFWYVIVILIILGIMVAYYVDKKKGKIK